FDGLTFRLVQPPGLTSGRDSALLTLRADPKTGLWAVLRNATLVRYRGDAFEDLPPALGAIFPSVTAMAAGRGGWLVAAVLDHGVVASGPDRLDTVVTQRAMPGSYVIAMAQTPDGDVWLGTRDSGLLRQHEGRLVPIAKGLPDQKINSLLVSGN